MRVHFDGLRRPARVAKAFREELEALGVTVGLGRAQDLVAIGYGYASYKELQSVVGERPADAWDEDARPEAVAARRSRQADAFMQAGITRAQAVDLVARLGPSARRGGRAAVEAAEPAPAPVAQTLPRFESMPRDGREADVKAMAQAVAWRPGEWGPKAVLLDNGWLLYHDMPDAEFQAQVEAVLADRTRPVPKRILREYSVVVEAFRANADEPAATGFSALGNPAARRMLKLALHEARRARASEVAIVKDGAASCVGQRVDGALLKPMALKEGVAAAMSAEAHRLCEAETGYSTRHLISACARPESGLLPEGVRLARMSWTPLHGGGVQLDVRMVERAAPATAVPDPLRAFGYPSDAVETIARMRRRPAGINIVAGPARSGKTAGLAAILAHEPGGRVAMAVGGVSDRAIPGVTTVTYEDTVGPADERRHLRVAALRAAMDKGPDVLVVGDVTDRHMATLAFEAAMSGVQVWAAVRATDPFTALALLGTMGIEDRILHDTRLVTGLVGHRLVRGLCGECSMTHERAVSAGLPGIPDLERLTDRPSMRLPRGLRFANPEGCPGCREGHRGQRLVAEAVEPGSFLMRVLRDHGAGAAESEDRGPDGSLSLLAEATCLALKGEVDIREVEARVGVIEDLSEPWLTRAFDESIRSGRHAR